MAKKRTFDCDDLDVKARAEAAWGRLRPKRRRFCECYIVKCNAAEAAREAGYSERTAKTAGSRMLTNVDVADVIGGLQAERSRLAIISFERRAGILSQIALGSVASMLKADSTDTLDAEGVHAAGPALGSISHSSSSFTSEKNGESESERWSIKTRDPIAAIHELNLMYGDHAPKRVQVSEDGNADIDSFTDKQLEAWLAAEDGDEE